MSTATITRTATPIRTVAPTHTVAPTRTARRAGTRVGDRPVRGTAPEFDRPADGRPLGSRTAAPRVGGTRCATTAAPRVAHHVYAGRRAAALAVLVGVALAGLVWVIALVGSDYAAAVSPAPTGTEVVHVRAGDSLSSIAQRIAPDLPRQAVIDEIVARNDLSGSALQVGQALVAPAYR